MLTLHVVPKNLFLCSHCNTQFTGKDSNDCPICYMANGSVERVFVPKIPEKPNLHWDGGTLRGKHGELVAPY